MARAIPLLLIGLFLGGVIGFTIAAANGITLDGHDHAAPLQHGAHAAQDSHDHGAMLSVPGGVSAPTLSLQATRDPASGWNLHIMTGNFTFAPQSASGEHVPGEGHAHVHVNGVKAGRYYGPWVHLDGLPAGTLAIEVTLTANDHRPLAVDGVPLTASVIVEN
jgi:hypothetical protein